MCFSSAPKVERRDPAAETAATLRAQSEMESGTGQFADLGPRIELERKFAPQYARLDFDIARDILLGGEGQPGALDLLENEIAPAQARMESAALSQRRQNDIADVNALAGDSRAAFDKLNPQGAALLRQLTDQASTELSAGRGLTAGEERQYQQAARSAGAARGFGFGQDDAFNEALTVGEAGNRRLRERQQEAKSALVASQGFYGDPFMAILGRSSNANPQALLAQGQSFNPGQVLNPTDPYFGDAYNYNANAQNAANISQANNRAGMIGSLIGGVGLLGGGYLGRPRKP